ncbi:MAG TPA: hypothetical protein VFP72_07805, partial [Kineosporiaceae bacterium]|nr:hypothetical protein [Kineosporiaceae bacterium]
IMQGLGHYPTKALGHALGGILGKNAGHEAGHWAGETIRGGVHEWVTDGASGAAQHQGWNPDTFSTTAGALDEGISGLAGLGGRKGGHRHYTGMLTGNGRTKVPGTGITVPDHGAPGRLTLEPTGAEGVPGPVDRTAVSAQRHRMEAPDPTVTSGALLPPGTGSAIVGEARDPDHDFGKPVPPKRIKDHELDDAGDPRYNPLWTPLNQVRPSRLTADRNVTWTYSVTEDGRVMLGSEHPSQAISEEQLTELVAGMRQKDEALAAMTPEQARQAILEKLDGLGHVGIAVGSTPDGRTVPGRSRVAGEFRWREDLGSWAVNDKSGRYMSDTVRADVGASDQLRWLGNVAAVFSAALGIDVHAVPYKQRS